MARWILLGLMLFLTLVWLYEWNDRRNDREGPPKE